MSKLNADRIKDAEYARRFHRVNLPAGLTVEDLSPPEFWGHVSGKFTRGDILEVFAEDNSFYAELLVLDCSRLHAKVEVLLHKKIGAAKAKTGKPEDADFTFEFKGPQRKWTVIRKKDKEIAKDGFADAAAAAAWLEANRDDLT